MRPFNPLHLLLAADGGSEWVTGHHQTFSGSSWAVSLAGASVGDLALIVVQNGNTTPTDPAGWNKITMPVWTTLSYVNVVYWKVLAAGDFSSPPTVDGLLSGASGVFAAYRGPASVSLKSATDVTSATLTVPGFVKAAKCMGVVIVSFDRDPGSNPAPPAAAGISHRVDATSTFFKADLFDFAQSQDYPEASLTFTGYDAASEQRGIVLELLSS